MSFMDINAALNSFVWGPIMLLLLVGTGVYFSISIGFPQFRHFIYVIKNTLGKIFQKTESAEGEMTPFQAVSTALASTVGTGNIAGVTGAIVLGGPGAVFWMWISALFGMCTKFCEVTLAVRFRERDKKGDWVGGPMYYIKNGMGEKWKWLGMLFSLLAGLAAFGIGNMTQINSITTQVKNVAQVYTADTLSPGTLGIISLVTSIIIALFVGFVVIGGIKRIGRVTETLVPFMALVYIICSFIVVFKNAAHVPAVFASIFEGAFSPQAAVGGIAGFTMLNAMQRGVARGVFSNEAGLGSAPMAHAATSETNPVRQGLYGIFEVFVDTIVVCTLTAFVVLSSGIMGTAVQYGDKAFADSSTTAMGFQTVFGDQIGSMILAVGLLMFATSTILGWSLYGVRCAQFIFGDKAIKPYELIYCLIIVVPAIFEISMGSADAISFVWDIADTMNGLMAIPNLIGLLILSPVVIKLAREFFSNIGKEETA